VFSRISRYRKLPDEAVAGPDGRTSEARSLRLLPAVSGTLLHTVSETDRLDHLASRYYREPRNWWRICDANGEFLSPRALLGQEPVVTDRFPLAFDDDDGPPPWSALVRAVSGVAGVEEVRVEEVESGLRASAEEVDGEPVVVDRPIYRRALVVTYNRINVGREALALAMAVTNFEVGAPESIGRVGKSIVIPPRATS
jgi:hypothetical protein